MVYHRRRKLKVIKILFYVQNKDCAISSEKFIIANCDPTKHRYGYDLTLFYTGSGRYDVTRGRAQSALEDKIL